MITVKDLESYNTYLGDKEKIKARIKTLQLKFNNCTDNLKATTISDMPKNFSSEFNSATENVLLKKEKLLEQIQLLEITISEISEKLVDINMSILKLNQDEQFIVRKFYIENIRNCPTIADLFKKEFGKYKHPSTIWKKLKKALKKI